jgi:hypothetical protein
MTPGRPGALLLATFLSAGCAVYTSSVRPDERPDPDRAYLYGRFHVRANANSVSVTGPGYQTMGLMLECANGERHTIPFRNSRDVQVIRVRPSRCALTQIIYSDEDGMYRGSKEVPAHWIHAEEFVAGRAYYLGDYFGSARFEIRRRRSDEPFWPGGIVKELTWDVDPVDDNFDLTTTEMKRGYAGLASLVTEDKRLIPRRRAVESTRVSIPGDPMSPERIARVAGFIGHRYGTQAECAASCRSGQCFAYRDQGAVVMTCVVPCHADSDCPEGLACNCAADGADCHPIASTSTDPMTGLCLARRGTPETVAP